jgi:hypothetical protein
LESSLFLVILFIFLFGRLFHWQHGIFVLQEGLLPNDDTLVELFFNIFVVGFIILYGSLFLLFGFFLLASGRVFLVLTSHQIFFSGWGEGRVLLFLALHNAFDDDESHG